MSTSSPTHSESLHSELIAVAAVNAALAGTAPATSAGPVSFDSEGKALVLPAQALRLVANGLVEVANEASKTALARYQSHIENKTPTAEEIARDANLTLDLVRVKNLPWRDQDITVPGRVLHTSPAGELVTTKLIAARFERIEGVVIEDYNDKASTPPSAPSTPATPAKNNELTTQEKRRATLAANAAKAAEKAAAEKAAAEKAAAIEAPAAKTLDLTPASVATSTADASTAETPDAAQ